MSDIIRALYGLLKFIDKKNKTKTTTKRTDKLKNAREALGKRTSQRFGSLTDLISNRLGWSDNQQSQFLKNYNQMINSTKYKKSYPSVLARELQRVEAKVKRLSNKHFSGKQLTPAEQDWVEQYSYFFGDDFDDYWHGASSSWILVYRWERRKNSKKKVGKLYVQMIRGKTTYVFPKFPFYEYIMLRKCTVHVGTYWWQHYLWKYGVGGKYSLTSLKTNKRSKK